MRASSYKTLCDTTPRDGATCYHDPRSPSPRESFVSLSVKVFLERTLAFVVYTCRLSAEELLCDSRLPGKIVSDSKACLQRTVLVLMYVSLPRRVRAYFFHACEGGGEQFRRGGDACDQQRHRTLPELTRENQ